MFINIKKKNNWLPANGLKVYTNKLKYMMFGKPNNKNIPVLELPINNVNIDKVQNSKFL